MKPALRWLAIGALCAANVGQAATFQFSYVDDPAEGLNDTTPFTPEGGNNATTLGQARRNVLDEAGRLWGLLLTSNVPIKVDASVDPLTCTVNSATLAQARPTLVYRNPAGPKPNVYYPSALMDALTGADLNEGSPSTAGRADILVRINLSLHNDASCFGGSRFYYGFDHAGGLNQPDLLQVLMHEIAHGLGFTSLVDLTTGNGLVEGDGIDRVGSYDQFIYDESVSLPWTSMTASQRLQSAVRGGSLAWSGANVNRWRARYSSGSTAAGRMLLYAPSSISTGSSVSHWDTSLTPNALMEPVRQPTTSNFTDLTTCAMKDIGWTVARCIDGSNAAPVAQGTTITVLEDTPTNIPLVGTDADGDSLTFALVTTPAMGSLSAPSAGSTASTLYTPNANASGSDSFSFTAIDDSATSGAATITINITPVNDAPVAHAKTATVESGKSIGVVLTGSDVEGDALTFAVVSQPASGKLSGTPPNLTYKSNKGFTGVDTFTYRASDAALDSAPVTVSVTVTAATGGGGGGATDLALLSMLAALAGVAVRARLRAARS
jgi:hypothetical protein